MKPDPTSPDYVKVKRSQTGACNICQTQADLKWDHVPPQGGINVAPLDQYTILERLAGRSLDPNRMLTQNGVKYRTLCQQCNSKLLGGGYDQTLNEFALTIGRLLKTKLHLPRHVSVVTKPARLLRSLFGHLLAAKAGLEHMKPDEAMRQYVLDPAARLPPDLNVFYFVYPYPDVVVIRDVVMLARRGRFDSKGMFSILKYFPIAYVVANLKQYEGLQSLSFHCPHDLDQEVDIQIPLRTPRPRDWPEVVDDGNLVIGGGSSGQSSVAAIPKGAKLRGPTKT